MSKIILNTPYNTDESFPTVREIKENYLILMNLVGNVTTLEQAKEIEEKYTMIVKINNLSIDDFEKLSKEQTIKWISYDDCGWLDYIYCYIENGKITDVRFDVWSNKFDGDFIESAKIDDITEEFIKDNINREMLLK